MVSMRKQRGSIGLMVLMVIVVVLLGMNLRVRENALRDDLFTVRSVIDQYTLDQQRPPDSFDELVAAGYLTKEQAFALARTTKAKW